MMQIASYAVNEWITPGNSHSQMSRPVMSAVDGTQIGLAGGRTLDTQSMLRHAREVGGPALRTMGFHDRAKLLKALAAYLDSVKEPLYTLSHLSGATLADAKIDIDGGIGTLFVYASKGRRELPDSQILLDGDLEQLSRHGSFQGQHIASPKHGVAVHINAFNFPVWGMLEKLGPALLAGVPVIVKPATSTSYIAESAFRHLIESGLLPDGALQLIVGGTGTLLDNLGAQDVVCFTGSAATALSLRANPRLLQQSVTFIAEQDSLNATVLGPDANPGSPEFTLLINEIVQEMTSKAGQKCTAIRRILCPSSMLPDVAEAVSAGLSKIRMGNPALADTTMGALVSDKQKMDVSAATKQLLTESRPVYDGASHTLHDADWHKGAFIAPCLLQCDTPHTARLIHEVEAFGPVATLMPYVDADDACQLLNRGGGSLVASVFTHDPQFATQIARQSACWHGRLYINNRDSMAESTGHGSPLPHMHHGGPGRAGGGAELGGIRSVMHYLQRTAIQGSADMISRVADTWVEGSSTRITSTHPFKCSYNELALGDTLHAGPRMITLDDIEHFAHFTGDTFYAHMDEAAAAASPFFEGRVAHGYLLLAFAAGLFVEPAPGPVLANTGLHGLKFLQPVAAGDSISVDLTVKRKTRRTETYGEIRWHVSISNQHEQAVASYELHTMNSYQR